jgi:5-oxoprolinase (ATP-hydrolysing)
MVFDPVAGKQEAVPLHLRKDLAPGMHLSGPALIVEPQTTTLVPRGWRCGVTAAGHLLLEKQA